MTLQPFGTFFLVPYDCASERVDDEMPSTAFVLHSFHPRVASSSQSVVYWSIYYIVWE